ncbi:glycoside hydrolase family 55 protein [Roseomonas sp. GC11]|uniref:glycoside hydrolase family 55 protein n=2 Tax=Roseomonas sp. GC11 TaxID=2950546 RepID=UPI0021094D59|nr:glycoside hydrolase family 55 protein [Roseomonas sp. GC11]MCQ4160968.1 glycoside hydrolase family 55 protein [Roseomonas sp. GC11]
MPARIDDLMVLNTAVSKTDLAKYLRDREEVLPTDFGGIGDGVTDNTAAIQAAFDRAAADGKFAVIPPGTWNVSAGVSLAGGARGLKMRGVIRYTGSAAIAVLTLGSGGTVRNNEKLYQGLQVIRQTQSNWADEADVGMRIQNIDSSTVEIRLVQGFTIGVQTLGDGRGVEDSTLFLYRILNAKIGLDVRCNASTSWNTSIRYYGGHIAQATGINTGQDRYGVRFSRVDASSYNNHNRHIFDGTNFELKHIDGTQQGIPFLNETGGSAIIGRNLRLEGCSNWVARHTASAQDCEYEVAWSNSYRHDILYDATATRCGNTVLNRHRAPASRHLRLLGAVPSLRAAAFRQSSTEIGVEGLATISLSTTTENTLAGLSLNGATGIAATSRGLLLDANRGLAFVLDTQAAKEFALVHSLAGGANGGRLFLRTFNADGSLRENIAGDVLASLTTPVWNTPSKSWTGGAAMADASLNRRMTVRVAADVAAAQISIVGFDGPIEIEALRVYGLPEHAPALLCGTPALPVGQRDLVAEITWDLPSLAPGATSLLDVAIPGARQGDLAQAALVSSTRFIELDAAAWTNNTVRVMARNMSPSATFDLVPVTLSVQVKKRRVG